MHHPQPSMTPGWNKRAPLPVHTHLALTGGLPGWQIAVIAMAVVLAAGLALAVYRKRVAGQSATTSTA